MKKYMSCFVCLLLVVSFFSFGVRQENELYIIMDIDYAGVKYLYDKPGGRVIKKMKHDMEGEDFIVFSIVGKTDSMFHVKAYYSIKDYIDEGWVKKDRHLEIFTRETPSHLFTLYQKADLKSPIVVIDKEFRSDACIVIDFQGQWLKIRTVVNGKIYEGWIPPEMQCANPYSTCC